MDKIEEKQLVLECLCKELEELENKIYLCSGQVKKAVCKISGERPPFVIKEIKAREENNKKDPTCVINQIRDVIDNSTGFINDILNDINRLFNS